MRNSRLILKSVIAGLTDQFTNQAVMGRPYNVYGESEMRAGTAPVFPYLYMFDFGVVFQKEHLPLVVVHPSVSLVTFELGNTSFHVNLMLHLFAENRGQRYDMASAIMESVDSFAMLNAVGGTVDVAQLLGDQETGRLWFEEYTSIGRDIAIEGSLADWVTLVTSFIANFPEGD